MKNVLARATGRKVDLSHLAFYRACIQRVDLTEAARLYLGEGISLREAAATLRWVRDELVHAAILQNRPDIASLLEYLPPRRKKHARAEKFPTLDEYRETKDPYGIYSEAELYEFYRQDYPQAFADTDRELERRLRAVAWASQHLVSTPRLTDSVAVWFSTDKACALIDAGIRSLGDLKEYMQSRGHRWWAGIRGIGRVQGQRIAGWFARHEDTLGGLAPEVLHPPRRPLVPPARETGIRPLEAFGIPSALDGSAGKNRFPGRPGISAQNDYQAIEAFLKSRSPNPSTQRAYRREAERLLLWAVLEKGLPLSSLGVEELAEYRDWLAALGRVDPDGWRWRIPQSEWIGRRNAPRWSKSWRPFDGPLAPKSQEYALTVLKSMFGWMARMRYLEINPLDGVAKPRLQAGRDDAPEVELTRFLTRTQLKHALDYLSSRPPDEAVLRLRFIILLAYTTGLRRSEMVQAKLKHLEYRPKNGTGGRWMLRVLGKGGRARTVPVAETVLKALREYLACRGLEFAPRQAEKNDAYLIAHVLRRKGGEAEEKPLDPATLYYIVKRFFAEVSRHLRAQGLYEDASHLERASTHWLRHTCGSHLAENNPMAMVAELLGHASLATTSRYVHTDKEKLHEAVEKDLGGLW